MIYLLVFGVFAFAFLLGSIPTAYLVVKGTIGRDVTEEGSKNCGATNARRVTDIYCGVNSKQGTITFYAVIILDALKGAMPVAVAMQVFSNYDNRLVADSIFLCTAILSVLGHDLMPFLKKGSGKGVSTSAGAILMLAPIPTLISVAIFFLARLITATVSRRSLLGAIAHPVMCIIVGAALPIVFGSIFLVALLMYRHKSNIVRIQKGEE